MANLPKGRIPDGQFLVDGMVSLKDLRGLSEGFCFRN